MRNTWLTAHASVIGAGHVKTGAPCQDASVIKTSDDGEWMAIVVSDGAGTADRSDEGSQHVAHFFCDELLKLVSELERRPPGHWINDFVIEKVLETRKTLRSVAKSDNIRDFNCTLVACLQGPSGGFSIHIGDGTIIGGYRDESAKTSVGRLFVSEPENGEYSNETFFITEGDWVKHLRITPIPKLDWLLCSTDGGGSLALISDKEPKVGFLQPVMNSVFSESDSLTRSQSLAAYLCDPQADKVTGDDKTLALAIKFGKVPQLDQYFQEQQIKDASTSGASVYPSPHISASPTPPLVPATESPKRMGKKATPKANQKRTKNVRNLIIGVAIISTILIAALMSWGIWTWRANQNVHASVPTIQIKQEAVTGDQNVKGSVGVAGAEISAHSEASAPQAEMKTFETRQLDGAEKK